MAEGDRFEKRREVFGARQIDYKVSILDTNGGLFISEIMNDLKGGPARHTHHEQDEWSTSSRESTSSRSATREIPIMAGRFRPRAEKCAACLGSCWRGDRQADRRRPARRQAGGVLR